MFLTLKKSENDKSFVYCKIKRNVSSRKIKYKYLNNEAEVCLKEKFDFVVSEEFSVIWMIATKTQGGSFKSVYISTVFIS